jgi:hypothetical protein
MNHLGSAIHLSQSKHGARTELFDLSTDPREETNVADKYPDVVKTILNKIPGYMKKMVKINTRTSSNEGRANGIWCPWVKVLGKSPEVCSITS